MKRPSVFVLGCGSIGRRHIANLRALGCRVTAFDPDPARAQWVRRNLGCETAASAELGLAAKPDAVWVCTPPHLHAAGAIPALRRAIPCFIEKPLAHDAASARSIIAAARGRSRVAVGYQLRAHPALRWLKKTAGSGRFGRLLILRAHVGLYLPDWRPWQDYRRSYTARRSMGGGILLDASHELDLARWIAGEASTVFCSAKKVSRLKIDVEDVAALQLGFRSGAVGEVHLDMVSRAPRRGLEVTFENGTILWDWISGELRVYTARSKRWTTKRYSFDFNKLYIEEAVAFLRSSKASVSAADGLRTLKLVEAAAESARGRRMERIAR